MQVRSVIRFSQISRYFLLVMSRVWTQTPICLIILLYTWHSLKSFTQTLANVNPGRYYHSCSCQNLHNGRHHELEILKSVYNRSQWPHSLRRRFADGCLLRLWVRMPPVVWMSVCCDCCVLSGRGLCDELITSPEESNRLWCVCMCVLETSSMRWPWPAEQQRQRERERNKDWLLPHALWGKCKQIIYIIKL